jgi:DNA-binding XRE family transcriptional regulator
MPAKQKEKPFSEILRQARTDIAIAIGRDKKLTQTEMARVLGVAPNYVAMLEKGGYEPSATIRNCLAYAVRLATLYKHDPLLIK